MSDPPLNAAARHLQAALAVGGDDLTDRELLARYADGDTVALARLVRRHGPLVYGVCRRALRDPNDAEDAFQATFLALVVRARAGGWRESVAGWLHEVATRVSAKARVAAASKGSRPSRRPIDSAPRCERSSAGCAAAGRYWPADSAAGASLPGPRCLPPSAPPRP